MKQNGDCRAETIDYLIVTRPLFADSSQLQDFILWKEQRGFRVGLLTVEWIDANYQGEHVAAKIKAAVLDSYAGSRADYALFVGDTEVHVLDLPEDPGRWYEPTEMYDLSKPWNVPTGAFLDHGWMSFSDIYYTDADPWPQNADGKPSLTGPCYCECDIMVGRFPVRTPQEISNILFKSKWSRPAYSAVTINATDSGQQPDTCIWPPTLGDSAMEEACYVKIPYSIDRALAGSGIAHHYYMIDVADQAQVDQARNMIYNSASVVLVAAHGGIDGNFVFGVSELCNFKTVFPLYVAHSCWTNCFYSDQKDSLTEAMLKSDKGPVVICGGYNTYFLYKGLSEGKTVGEALYRGQRTYFGGGLTLVDLLGDPSLRLMGRSRWLDDLRRRRWMWPVEILLRIWEGLRPIWEGLRPRSSLRSGSGR
jgi:hypothetical protein